MVPVFEGKKLAGWTGWDPAVRKREVGVGIGMVLRGVRI